MRTYANQFGPESAPPAAVLEALARLGWEDTSWGNDACPSFEKGNRRLWVEAKNPALREFPDERYILVERLSADELGDVLWWGEQDDEVIRKLEEIG
jgi:hypothetical protein